jgi:FlaA1/EpsC-like NDP-sugar epimerase
MFSRVKKIAMPLVLLPRWAKRIIVILLDTSICIFATWLAFYLRIGEFVTLANEPSVWPTTISVLLAIPMFAAFGLYREVFRYAGLVTVGSVAIASVSYGFFYAMVFTAIGINGVPRTIGLIQPMLLLLLVSGSRLISHLVLNKISGVSSKGSNSTGVLVFGTGIAGRQIAAALKSSLQMTIVGFIDDDPQIYGCLIDGIRVHSPFEVTGLVRNQTASLVILALETADRARRKAVVNSVSSVPVRILTLPSISDMMQDQIRLSSLKELEVDDLLDRPQALADPILLHKKNSGKVVLVTGAGGSIGAELCRQILTSQPKTLILLDHSEFALYTIHQELKKNSHSYNINLVPMLGSVGDELRTRQVLFDWKPHTIYHAAAYKHVPLLEDNAIEGLKNNLFATLNIVRLAKEVGVNDFVLISSDKAVRPSNLMGATKRMAEMVLQAFAESGREAGEIDAETTIYSIVRFGNVLDSSGSVLPTFRKQITDGGPITLTHEEVTRYFMTIPEAAQLVIQAAALAEIGGQVYVLDMGEPVKIKNLAIKLLTLAGLSVKDAQNPDGDIEIITVGLRPGEKLHEELVIGSNLVGTRSPRIMMAEESFVSWEQLEPVIELLRDSMLSNDSDTAKKILATIVEGYGSEVA